MRLQMIFSVLLVTALVAGTAYGSYTSTFDSGPDGWDLSGINSWTNNPGFDGQPGRMESNSGSDSFIIARLLGGNPTNPNFAGDIATLWGPEIHFSFWVRDLDASSGSNDVPVSIFSPTGGNTTFEWTPQAPGGAANWVKLSNIIRTDWSDSEAAANGWVKTGGTDSIGDVLSNVDQFIIRGVDSDGHAAWDQITIDVPEPASLALLSLGGLMLIRRRR